MTEIAHRQNAQRSDAEVLAERLPALLPEAQTLGQAEIPKGTVARYIPELAKADPAHLAIVVRTVDGERYEIGDTEVAFTFQSVSKVFALALLLRERGLDIFDSLSCEPSGDAFHSIVRLEEEQGRPRNPYINAGAILVSGALPGDDPTAKINRLQSFLADICDAEPFPLDEAVFRSESATGFRNRALANYMQHFGRIADAKAAAETYFRQCSLSLTARQLARLGLFLASSGVDPISGQQVISPECNRTAVALMATCGLYDEVGQFAISVGLPAKSGVSGAILAVVPGRMTIATYSPALGPKGNSVAGLKVLQFLSDELGLSLFG